MPSEMSPDRAMISVDVLRLLLDYDPETGVLWWKPRSPIFFWTSRSPDADAAAWNRRYANRPAGSLTYAGYVSVCVLGTNIQAHRVIWAMITGAFPEPSYQIDHIDGRRANNRWKNLRVVSHADNAKNKATYSKKSGLPNGIDLLPSGHFRVYINLNKMRRTIGTFDTIEAAAEARQKVSTDHDFHPNHGRTTA